MFSFQPTTEPADEEYDEEETEDESDGKVYLVGGYNVLAVVAGLTFVLSVWRLVDDPSYTFWGEEAFNVVMNYVLPALVVSLAMFMVVCMINGQAPGSEVVPPGNLTKVVVLLIVYIGMAIGFYYGKAFLQFVVGSFFGASSPYYLAFILFSVNPERNPMLTSPKFDPEATALSFYAFLVPAGFGLLNAGCYLIFTVWLELSRLSAAKIAASLGFVVIQLIGAKNYPGFSHKEKLCYLTGSLGLYVFVFTGVCLWAEQAIKEELA
mmetsp:Transcript_86765/g.163633  ORF Transcript_86765/g.163633 Transcript_86765/m.163633 type:complete len:265 (-) Transcript_86765:71-865(-)